MMNNIYTARGRKLWKETVIATLNSLEFDKATEIDREMIDFQKEMHITLMVC